VYSLGDELSTGWPMGCEDDHFIKLFITEKAPIFKTDENEGFLPL
jgi:hypothetical protein